MVRLRMVSEREEIRERRAPCLRHFSVCGQNLRCLTAVRHIELVDLGSSRRVVYDFGGGWTSDRAEAQTEGLKRVRW